MAYGAAALKHNPPLLHSGVRLPRRFVEVGADLLRANGLFPDRGYLE